MIMSYVLGSPLTCNTPNQPLRSPPPFFVVPHTLFLIHPPFHGSLFLSNSSALVKCVKCSPFPPPSHPSDHTLRNSHPPKS